MLRGWRSLGGRCQDFEMMLGLLAEPTWVLGVPSVVVCSREPWRTRQHRHNATIFRNRISASELVGNYLFCILPGQIHAITKDRKGAAPWLVDNPVCWEITFNPCSRKIGTIVYLECLLGRSAQKSNSHELKTTSAQKEPDPRECPHLSAGSNPNGWDCCAAVANHRCMQSGNSMRGDWWLLEELPRVNVSWHVPKWVDG